MLQLNTLHFEFIQKYTFTVFSTKQKKTMLKWLDELRPAARGGGDGDGAEATPAEGEVWAVIELEAGVLSLMCEASGETVEAELPDGELGGRIRAAFEAGGAVDVRAAECGGRVAVRALEEED